MWHAFKLTVLWHCTSPRQWKWNTWPSTRRDTVINRTSYTCCFCGCGTWLVCLWSGTLAHSVCRGPICKCEDNFNIILHEESVRIWIWFVFRNSGQWWAFVSAVMNWGFYKTRGFYSLVEQLSDSQKKVSASWGRFVSFFFVRMPLMHVAVRSCLLVSGESDVLLHCLINECLSEGLLGSCKARHRWGVKVLTVRRPEFFWKAYFCTSNHILE
jgi:hypothetical protein